ncbi:MAG TPA: hypothetical protein PLW14_10000 [Chlorobiota bacterium]|nr:hypothetical protein [Chlorobiota bacterium]
MRTTIYFLALVVAIIVSAMPASSQNTPRLISWQGLISQPDGRPVLDADHDVTFTIHDAPTGGTVIWTESHRLRSFSGVVDAVLGSRTPLSIRAGRQLWLSIRVDGNPAAEPRLPIIAVPLALYADTARAATSVTNDATGVVRSANSLQGDVLIEGAGGTTVTKNGTTVTISTPTNGITSLTSDGSVTIGNGTGPQSTVSLADGAVTSSKITDNAVTTAKLANSAITTQKLADGSVVTSTLVNGAVTTEKLANGSVTTEKLAEAAVTTPKLADGSVRTQHLGDEAVGIQHLADGSVTTRQLAPTGVTPGTYGSPTTTAIITVDASGRVTDVRETNITGVRPGGPAGGDLTQTYPAPELRDGSVTTDAIRDGAVTSVKIARGAVTTQKFVDGVITTTHFADQSVTSDLVANGAITTEKIADAAITSNRLVPTGVVASTYGDSLHVARITIDSAGRITTIDTVRMSGIVPGGPAGGDLSGTYPDPSLRDLSVTTRTLADGAVTADKLADGSVSARVLQDRSVTEEKLADSAVTTRVIRDRAVTTNKFGANVGTPRTIGNGSVSRRTIADTSITSADLAPTGVTPSTYGHHQRAVNFSVDISGRLTTARDTVLSGVPPGGSANGDLTGLYPAPSIATSAGNNIVTAVNNAATTQVVSIQRGGTGASTRDAALRNLLPPQSGATTTQFLRTDGTTPSWATLDTVGGSGTTNTLVRWNGERSITSVDTSVWQASNGRLSIGTGAFPGIMPSTLGFKSGDRPMIAFRHGSSLTDGWSGLGTSGAALDVIASPTDDIVYGNLHNGAFEEAARITSSDTGQREGRLVLIGDAQSQSDLRAAHIELLSPNTGIATNGTGLRWHTSNRYWGGISYSSASTGGQGLFTFMSYNTNLTNIRFPGALIFEAAARGSQLVPAAGVTRMYFDQTSRTIKYSETGRPFRDLVADGRYVRIAPPETDLVDDRSRPLFYITTLDSEPASIAYGSILNATSVGTGDINATALRLEAYATGNGIARAFDGFGDFRIYGPYPIYRMEGLPIMSYGPTLSISNTYIGLTRSDNYTPLYNTIVGTYAGENATSGNYSTVVGSHAGRYTLARESQLAIGTEAGYGTLGRTDLHQRFTSVGARAGWQQYGDYSVAVGRDALRADGTSIQSVVLGADAGRSIDTSNSLVAVGYAAATQTLQAFSTTSVGAESSPDLSIANEHSAIGYRSGTNVVTSVRSTFIGARTGTTTYRTDTLLNATAVGYRARVDTNNAVVLGSVEDVGLGTPGTNVGIGTTAPTRRLDVVGTVQLQASGPVVHAMIKDAISFNIPNVPAADAIVFDAPYPNARVGSIVNVSPSETLPDLYFVRAHVPVDGTVRFQVVNRTAGDIDLGVVTFSIYIVQL